MVCSIWPPVQFIFLTMRAVYRVALLLLSVSSFYCDYVIPQNPLESQVLILLNKWRVGHVDTGIIPLPSLRSIKIPDVSHSYDRKGIKMTYILKKMELTGLDSFIIQELTALAAEKSLEMSISMNIPKLSLYADSYELKGRAYLMYPLKGSGNMTVIFRDSDLTFKLRLTTAANGISARIEDFRFDFNVRQIEANLVDSSWPINKVLNSEGVEILGSYHGEIVQALWAYIVPYANSHLMNVTTAEIVNSILTIDL